MASAAISAQGTLFKIGDGSSSEVFTLFPECIDVGLPEVKTDYLETTSHDSASGFKEWIAGLRDGGSIPIKFNLLLTNTIQNGARADSYAGTRRNFKIVTPAATLNTCSFSAYVDWKATANKNTVLVGDISLRITGLPVWS